MNQKEYETKFFQLLKAMGEFYEKTFSGIVYEMWFTDIRRFDYESVKKAFAIHRQNPDNGKFMPKPGDIIRILEGTSKDKGYLAWTKTKRAIQSVGSYQSIVFDDPIIHRVIKDLGGWIELCSKTEKELPFIANEFRSRYEGYKAKGELPDFPRLLPGLHESENSKKKLIDYIQPDPILVGDKKKAVLLLTGKIRKYLQLT